MVTKEYFNRMLEAFPLLFMPLTVITILGLTIALNIQYSNKIIEEAKNPVSVRKKIIIYKSDKEIEEMLIGIKSVKEIDMFIMGYNLAVKEILHKELSDMESNNTNE